jgi:ribonuclease PH
MKLQSFSQNAIAILANGTTQIHGLVPTAATVALSDFGFPITGSMSMSFAVGFMKG